MIHAGEKIYRSAFCMNVLPSVPRFAAKILAYVIYSCGVAPFDID